MIEIIPAILSANITEVESMLKTIVSAVEVNGAKIKRAQIDVIDGVFVDNKTIDPSLLSNLDTTLNLDFHLMVNEPINWIEKCANAGADRIIGQIEMMGSQIDFVGKVQQAGLQIGLAVDLETPIAKLDPVVLTNTDVILLMAVRAGWGGQEFDRRVLSKIRDLDEIRVRDRTPFKICVDGGETESVIDDTYFAGADEVVIGRRLYKGDLATNINKMQEAANKK